MTEETKKETAIVETDQVSGFIQTAIEKDLDVEKLEKLLSMQERVSANNAKAAFVQALSKFQGDVPEVKKSHDVKRRDGTLLYTYADLEDIVTAIKKPLSDSGLSFRWKTEQNGEVTQVVCIITHVGGHSEESGFPLVAVELQNTTAPQNMGAALTYAKRYSLTNALGISTGDEDNDATSVKDEGDAKDPKAQIIFRLRKLGHEVTGDEVHAKVRELIKMEPTVENAPKIIKKLDELVEAKDQDTSHEN